MSYTYHIMLRHLHGVVAAVRHNKVYREEIRVVSVRAYANVRADYRANKFLVSGHLEYLAFHLVIIGRLEFEFDAASIAVCHTAVYLVQILIGELVVEFFCVHNKPFLFGFFKALSL